MNKRKPIPVPLHTLFTRQLFSYLKADPTLIRRWLVPLLLSLFFAMAALPEGSGSVEKKSRVLRPGSFSECTTCYSGSLAATGIVTLGSLAASGRFFLDSVRSAVPLRLIRFMVHRSGRYTTITWVTASEENIAHFDVQRSDDEINFSTISRQQARNSTAMENYTVHDGTAIRRIAWYRLLWTDNDGTIRHSELISMKRDDEVPTDLKLMTNPVRTQVVLAASGGLVGVFRYQINAVSGRLIKEGQLVIQGCITNLPLPSGMVPGIYLLQISNDHSRFSYKIVVQ